MMGANSTNMEDRNPKNLNQHLKVQWDDIIGEPDGVHGPECSWRLSGVCFWYSQKCCYIFLSVLFSPILALCLGCTFACFTFQHIWCIGPCLRVYKMSCATLRTCTQVCTSTLVIPFTEALGFFWYNMRIKFQKLPEVTERVDDILLI